MPNDESEKKKSQLHRKKSRKKNQVNMGLTQLTRHLGYEIEIIPQKPNFNKLWRSRPNNSFSNDEIKKKLISKKEPKNRPNLLD